MRRQCREEWISLHQQLLDEVSRRRQAIARRHAVQVLRVKRQQRVARCLRVESEASRARWPFFAAQPCPGDLSRAAPASGGAQPLCRAARASQPRLSSHWLPQRPKPSTALPPALGSSPALFRHRAHGSRAPPAQTDMSKCEPPRRHGGGEGAADAARAGSDDPVTRTCLRLGLALREAVRPVKPA